jgi:hypothetical protein
VKQRFPWYIPSWNGDLRLIPSDNNTTLLSIEDPTPDEERVLENLGKMFLEKGFVEEWTTHKPGFFAKLVGKKREIEIHAPLEKLGPLVVASMRPGPAVLTAITFAGGKCLVTDGAGQELVKMTESVVAGTPYRNAADVAPEEEKKPDSEKSKALKKNEPKAAATVRRPTPSCPQCQPGAIQPASEVLLSFLNEEEHASWAQNRFIVVEGGMSGHRYVLAHRHSRLAQHIGRVCYDLDAQGVVHFHDWRVPPEEEILAAKLILKYREPWLRNEATMFGCTSNTMRFKNPFGDISDGVDDASFTSRLAVQVLQEAYLAVVRKSIGKLKAFTV